MNFKPSLRAKVRQELFERRKLILEARNARQQFDKLCKARKEYSTTAIAQRHSIPVRTVRRIADTICWNDDAPAASDHTRQK